MKQMDSTKIKAHHFFVFFNEKAFSKITVEERLCQNCTFRSNAKLPVCLSCGWIAADVLASENRGTVHWFRWTLLLVFCSSRIGA